MTHSGKAGWSPEELIAPFASCGLILTEVKANISSSGSKHDPAHFYTLTELATGEKQILGFLWETKEQLSSGWECGYYHFDSQEEERKKNDSAVVDFFEGGMFDVTLRCRPFYMHIRQRTHTFLDSRIFMKMYNVSRDER